jgi:hypothetical protein
MDGEAEVYISQLGRGENVGKVRIKKCRITNSVNRSILSPDIRDTGQVPHNFASINRLSMHEIPLGNFSNFPKPPS